MFAITKPEKPKYAALGDNHGKIEIPGCFPGYGATLGNALRRVLLSSLSGAAATSLKIKGISHEFSTIPGVLEDVVQIILHLKQVRFRLHGEGPVTLSLKAKGEGPVTASQFSGSSDVEVVNGDQLIATLTDKKADFELEITVDRGLGYVPVEQRDREEREIGVIAIDSIYSPVRRVNYEIENMRVGKRTDFDKITLEIVTDGSISPEEAYQQSVAILVDQFSALSQTGEDEAAPSEDEKEASEEEKESEAPEEKPKKSKKKADSAEETA
jgi:DNA-directed RNA polymerase subunit alpha